MRFRISISMAGFLAVTAVICLALLPLPLSAQVPPPSSAPPVQIQTLSPVGQGTHVDPPFSVVGYSATTHPYVGVAACPPELPVGSAIRINGLAYGLYDTFTTLNDLYVCKDLYSDEQPTHINVYQPADITVPQVNGVYNVDYLGVAVGGPQG